MGGLRGAGDGAPASQTEEATPARPGTTAPTCHDAARTLSSGTSAPPARPQGRSPLLLYWRLPARMGARRTGWARQTFDTLRAFAQLSSVGCQPCSAWCRRSSSSVSRLWWVMWDLCTFLAVTRGGRSRSPYAKGTRSETQSIAWRNGIFGHVSGKLDVQHLMYMLAYGGDSVECRSGR